MFHGPMIAYVKPLKHYAYKKAIKSYLISASENFFKPSFLILTTKNLTVSVISEIELTTTDRK